MFTITGGALASYLLRVVKDIVIRNPRFNRTLGDVSVISGTKISFGDVQVLIRDVTTDSTRISFDHFISTMTGRAILAQVDDKDGIFIEWVTETDASQTTPASGIYIFTVQSVDEGTRDVGLSVESYRWYEGRLRNAQGTTLGFRTGIDATTLTITDTTSETPPTIQAAIGYVHLLSTVGGLLIEDTAENALTPNVDYWVNFAQSVAVIESTTGGVQTATIPEGMTSVSIVDSDGYTLRLNTDYIYVSPVGIKLSAWTASGVTIYAQGIVKLDPTIPANLVNPENTFSVTLAPGETIVPGQLFVSTQDADNISVVVSANGSITLPAPLPPGGWCNYEMRVLVGETQVTAQKNGVTNGLLPGLRIAIGDQVVVGDEVAILVSPTVTETYHVYGGKPGTTFVLDVKANDPTTADEIAKMLFHELLVERYDVIESDGLSLFEASSSMLGGTRDDSGTAPTYTTSLSFSGLADWRVYKPLVTRVRAFDVTTAPYMGGGHSKPMPQDRYSFLKSEGFLTGYR